MSIKVVPVVDDEDDVVGGEVEKEVHPQVVRERARPVRLLALPACLESREVEQSIQNLLNSVSDNTAISALSPVGTFSDRSYQRFGVPSPHWRLNSAERFGWTMLCPLAFLSLTWWAFHRWASPCWTIWRYACQIFEDRLVRYAHLWRKATIQIAQTLHYITNWTVEIHHICQMYLCWPSFHPLNIKTALPQFKTFTNCWIKALLVQAL